MNKIVNINVTPVTASFSVGPVLFFPFLSPIYCPKREFLLQICITGAKHDAGNGLLPSLRMLDDRVPPLDLRPFTMYSSPANAMAG